jgi:hypothetical protein
MRAGSFTLQGKRMISSTVPIVTFSSALAIPGVNRRNKVRTASENRLNNLSMIMKSRLPSPFPSPQRLPAGRQGERDGGKYK